MNILPFISALILLFALGSYSLVYKLKATTEEKIDYQNHLQVKRKFFSHLEYERFLTEKKPTEKNPNFVPPKPQKPGQARRSFPSSLRYKIRFSEESRLHIDSLFSKTPDPLLEKITLDLIRRLYEFTSLYTPSLETEVLEVIKKVKKEHPQISSFEELFQHLPKENSPLFYCLIKGTQAYTLFENRGYPSIADFISLKKESGSPLSFRKAHKIHLLAFFGDSFTAQILSQEEEVRKKEKRARPLGKKELEPLMTGAFKNSAELLSLLSFSSPKKPSPPAFILEEERGLTLKIPLPPLL